MSRNLLSTLSSGNFICFHLILESLIHFELILCIVSGSSPVSYKKDLNDPCNHDGVTTHLEPDILESEVKWALGSITTNKASRGDGISVELYQILKDDAVKVLHSVCQQMWKTQQWPQDWKRFSFQSQRKAMQRILKLLHNCTHLTR